MEYTFYSLNSIKTMEVVEINSGTRLGFIKDFKVDTENYKITSILMPNEKISIFGKNNDIEIPWYRIKKIGVDVILVDAEDIFEGQIQ
ncbi:YlmC/YmxH family sporulation protein [Clostridium cochlearium]|uniref:Sporulation protein, YlmC/YmxH family n=2 Tax=Clostridium cochlearium TaxID=1494 RepID=A0A239ZT22_CLOCO|nr:YlmC/YmxH family sporulation protein [Clostridium cochlearium]MBV1816919.1 YlmC/YmxH family sporulation protein [Bacteroidales bacterium MSK.15.36]NSJ91906.1 YlmC/YmxH family sporulation protein [Coprococcus sp. MSK.21.13]MBE6064189.1 YlmC/YmxH family sporulation protein [Clostridium cochlearium]MBU5269386.1 YlmC/YmxH family sporulation protein [Clostridium cochlearium]MCG4571055.1 YlmC/YmxH family sporulation protein [Clostridium cochlearium]